MKETHQQFAPTEYASLTQQEIIDIVRFEKELNNKRTDGENIYLLAYNELK